MKPKTYPLIKVGRYGKQLHAVDPSDPKGRAVCENINQRPYLEQDGSGGYSDTSRVSPVFPAGHGTPTCEWCLGRLP
jgi:hypothetical protein